jgi:4-hydroxy-2-oxoheptanedioate aldolase
LGFSPDAPELGKATEDGIAAILAVTRDLGKVAGIHATSVDDAKRRVAQGFRFMTIMADLRMMRAGATQALAAVRQ